MSVLGGKPRYEVRTSAVVPQVWDAERNVLTMDTPRDRREADRVCAALNREYQRWLTERFYDRAEAELGAER